MSQIFEILFQTGDINIFVLRGVFLADKFNEKAPFLTKKTSAVKSETLTWQRIKGKFHYWQNLEFWNVIHSTRLH